jgi:ribosome-binding factor A
MKDRINRVNSLIKEKIAEILQKEIFVKDVLITVQGVDTSKDLNYAKIKISTIPFHKSGEVFKIIEKNLPRLQKRIGEEIRIKFIPKIRFTIDKTEENASRVEKILKGLKNK